MREKRERERERDRGREKEREREAEKKDEQGETEEHEIERDISAKVVHMHEEFQIILSENITAKCPSLQRSRRIKMV